MPLLVFPAWDLVYSLDTGEPFEVEYRLREAVSGQYNWFIARAMPYRNQEDEIVIGEKRKREHMGKIMKGITRLQPYFFEMSHAQNH